jgi:hypothetical protein
MLISIEQTIIRYCSQDFEFGFDGHNGTFFGVLR